ncbi:MAG TPA: YebC/PmpR family DNA-binding transcriptional regulator [Candidatus Marinimicrobia bacterium]|mgnify:CR=1 FL=1|jgi:YebC/PmpR family DNA-binding regulatory protein|nr:YebC/PmpR family DNA-binding transcriptional regulator [Candidatus Neomarinimicrobiota bacterium]MDP6275983.1 YebC/PmpR family DNA-binding transcriptional regulator [Candidatus Neomarinimicrobiota bacterium]MDP7217031.1 YebC/PmpR family DNA-binding transcriptional regulator [Candidatus Neomarinimicrobiota bacterium]MDP7436445.1 YebC/PmpR family DNA-binding transcriptional regulator [Candidatus Neomarinimicrobiota bacterium]MDP7654207.1 YebC/PmpR family DNA-binding transcriptional regulator [|tara:strand:+ start:10592 stop:11317 length:726 start_codon:yes stop_codon:yes gene_type:complete
MSGHSKWATIKRKKAATDAKRGKIFTTIIKEITIAARDGGGDIDSNPRLRQAVANAKSANMPSNNIQRAIKKGTGELPGVTYEEATFEGYGPAGVAIMVECLTDNRKRTVAEIRHLIIKYGGNLGEKGSVNWMFDKKGQITVKANGHEEDTVFEAALEAGAEDFEIDGDAFIVSTDPSDIMSVRDNLENSGYEIESANVDLVPKNLQNVDSDKENSVITLLEALEDHDDIKAVYTNFDSED